MTAEQPARVGMAGTLTGWGAGAGAPAASPAAPPASPLGFYTALIGLGVPGYCRRAPLRGRAGRRGLNLARPTRSQEIPALARKSTDGRPRTTQGWRGSRGPAPRAAQGKGISPLHRAALACLSEPTAPSPPPHLPEHVPGAGSGDSEGEDFQHGTNQNPERGRRGKAPRGAGGSTGQPSLGTSGRGKGPGPRAATPGAEQIRGKSARSGSAPETGTWAGWRSGSV